MDDKRLRWLIKYLDVLSKLHSTRINEEKKAINAIEHELGLNNELNSKIQNINVYIDNLDQNDLSKLHDKIIKQLEFQKRDRL